MHIKRMLLITTLLFCTHGYAAEKAPSLLTPLSQPDNIEHIRVINVNSAHLEELAALPGIGKKKAQAIIDYRVKHGNFFDLTSLSQVKGIGQGILGKLEGKVAF